MILPDSSFYLGLSPKRASGRAQGASSGPKVATRETAYRSSGPESAARTESSSSQLGASASNPSRSSGFVYIASPPSGFLGHASLGRSHYNSTPLSSRSRRYKASLTP